MAGPMQWREFILLVNFIQTSPIFNHELQFLHIPITHSLVGASEAPAVTRSYKQTNIKNICSAACSK